MSGAITNKKGRVPPSFYYLLLIAATVTAGSLGGYFGRNQLLLILAKVKASEMSWVTV